MYSNYWSVIPKIEIDTDIEFYSLLQKISLVNAAQNIVLFKPKWSMTLTNFAIRQGEQLFPSLQYVYLKTFLFCIGIVIVDI